MADGVGPGPTTPDLRVVLANERTLLAWLRTSLGLMVFGFVVARLGGWAALRHAPGGGDGEAPSGSMRLGACVVLGASLLVLAAAARYHRRHAAILAGRPGRLGSFAPLVMAFALVVTGAGLAAVLVLR